MGESGRQGDADAGDASDCSRACFSLSAESGWGAMADVQVQGRAACRASLIIGRINSVRSTPGLDRF